VASETIDESKLGPPLQPEDGLSLQQKDKVSFNLFSAINDAITREQYFIYLFN
jgi:hypothetical protein